MIHIVLFGPPGSGKGTQAQNLVEKFQLKQISTGDLFRYNIKNDTELGKLAKSYIDKGELVPDQVTIDMLKTELKQKTDAKGFIYDGFPRTTLQAEVLDEIISEFYNEKVNITLALDVDDEVLVERLLSRGKTSGRVDDADETIIRNRIEEYYTKTREVADFYKNQNKYIEVEGIGNVEEISEKLFTEIEKISVSLG